MQEVPGSIPGTARVHCLLGAVGAKPCILGLFGLVAWFRRGVGRGLIRYINDQRYTSDQRISEIANVGTRVPNSAG